MLPFSEACERNKGPILEVLRVAFADRMQVLEIGSGTGQHAVHFAAHLTHLTWHPTEQLAYLADLASRVKLEGTRNLRPPTVLDVKQTIWPLRSVDAIYTRQYAAHHGLGGSRGDVPRRRRRIVAARRGRASTDRFATPAATHRTAIATLT